MFCGNCGNQIPDGSAQCPICGAPQQAAPVQQPVYQQPSYQQPAANVGTIAIVGLVCGSVSIPFSILGGILYGVPGAAFGLILGAAGLVLGIMTQKATNKTKGMGAFVCGLIGLIFGVLFMIGCSICGCSEKQTTGTCYTALGTCGGGCQMANDTKNAVGKLNDLNSLLNDYNW